MGHLPHHIENPNVCPSCSKTVEAVKQNLFQNDDLYFVQCSSCDWVHDAEYFENEVDELGVIQRRKYQQYVPPNISKAEHKKINENWIKEWTQKGKETHAPIVVIDLFCGAGGTTTGIHRAVAKGQAVAEVIACVNHSAKAIMSHEANYPNCVHFQEDMTRLDVKRLPTKEQFKNSIVILWLSPDCTSHSNAKNGPKNRSSRMLPRQAYRYIKHINPDVVMVENVREFQKKWGPLDDSDMPQKDKMGINYIKWRKTICRFGYKYSYQHMNAADYGGYTSRIRYFGMFVKEDSGLPVVFPEPTHHKKGHYGLPKWKPVREVLDFEEEGLSIFSPLRTKPLVENTLKRVYKGLQKHVEKSGKGAWIVKCLSNNLKTGVNGGSSIDEPCHTVTCQSRLYLAQATWLAKYNNANGQPNAGSSIEEPAGTLTAKCHQAICSAKFLYDYQGKGCNAVKSIDGSSPTVMGKETLGKLSAEFMINQCGCSVSQSVEDPCGTLLGKPKQSLVQPSFIVDNQFATMPKSTNEPAGTILTNNKFNLVTTAFVSSTNFENQPTSVDEPCSTLMASRKYHYLFNPQWGANTQGVDRPCFTIIARMDKSPPSLIVAESGKIEIKINEGDSEYTKKIKEFMNKYGIIDIKMRMLNIPELLRIQGFGDQYILCGSQADQKKFIGNSVHPTIPEHWFADFYLTVCNHPKKVVGQTKLFE
jgi:DNA (cytosine-5)-methyltransferase 1